MQNGCGQTSCYHQQNDKKEQQIITYECSQQQCIIYLFKRDTRLLVDKMTTTKFNTLLRLWKVPIV